MSELREIVLHGELARRFGKHHRFAVKSPAEAVRALSANFKGFAQHLVSSEERGVAYQVWAGGENLGRDDLTRQQSGRIYISPVVMGSKQGGLFQTILGAVLVVVGVIADIYYPGNPVSTYLYQVGGALALGGIAQLLSGGVRPTNQSDSLKSSFFDGPVNTTAQGNPVPVGYGLCLIGGAVVSAGISIDSQVVSSIPSGDTTITAAKGGNTAVRGKGTAGSDSGQQVKTK